jgi:nitrous oxidase accessory protein
MREQKIALILLMILCLLLVTIPEIGIVTAESTIYIRADGSIEGSDKIQRDGNIYTFLGNISIDDSGVEGIIVERDNIVIDGADFVLQKTGKREAEKNSIGLELVERTNVTIKNLQIVDFDCGIKLQWCSNNTLIRNYIYINSRQSIGMLLTSAHNNTISQNNLLGGIDSGGGISIDNFYMNRDSRANLFLRNNFTNLTIAIHNIASSRSIISGNNITNCKLYGILIDGCKYDELVGNVFENNTVGIYFVDASNNTIYHNNFINNQKDMDDEDAVALWLDEPSVNSWDNGFEGNYWSDYNGMDNDGDGIGDNPHFVYENNQDNYPLVEPYIIPEFPLWTPMPFALVVLAVAVVIYRRKLYNPR